MIPNPDREPPKKGEKLYKWALILEYNSYMGVTLAEHHL